MARRYISSRTKSIDEVMPWHCKKDYDSMYELLSLIGYNVNSNIHHQFCDKYNLPYRTNKMYRGSKNNEIFLEII